MKKTLRPLIVLLVLAALVPAASAESLFHVAWGKGAGQIGYYNASTPGFDQPYCEGPGGVALGANGEIWISDQFNDRILVYGHDGKFLRAVDQIGGQKIVRPKSLWLDGGKEMIVLSGKSNTLLRYDIKAGTVNQIGSTGGGAGQLRQPELLGISADRVCVEDDWKSELVCFARNGSGAVRQPWVLGGLGVDGAGGLYTLEFREQGGSSSYELISTGTDGKKVDHFQLKSPAGESGGDLSSPQLLGLDASGNAMVKFLRKSSKKAVLVRYDAKGDAGKILGELPVEIEKQAYAMTPDGGILALAFDAATAPKGGVDVVEYK